MTIGSASRAGLAYEKTSLPPASPAQKQAPSGGGHYKVTISPEAMALAKAQKGG